MRVLLVYPEFPDTFWSFRDALKFVGKKASMPPTGLLTIASMLPAEWEKRLVDMNVKTLDDKELEYSMYMPNEGIKEKLAYIESILKKHETPKN